MWILLILINERKNNVGIYSVASSLGAPIQLNTENIANESPQDLPNNSK